MALALRARTHGTGYFAATAFCSANSVRKSCSFFATYFLVVIGINKRVRASPFRPFRRGTSLPSRSNCSAHPEKW
jgi:hypothetical protein